MASIRAMATLQNISIGQARHAAINICAIVFWAIALLGLKYQISAALTETFVSLAMILTLPDISKPLRLPLLICTLVLVGLVLESRNIEPLLRGLDFAAPLAGFLVAVGVLRAALTGGARGAIAHSRLGALPPEGRRSAMLLLSFVLSAVFLVGVFPLLAPLAAAQDQREVDRMAAASLCGGALSFLWSPFSVGTAFVTATVGVKLGPATTGFMFAVALCGLGIGLLTHGRLRPSVLRQTWQVVGSLIVPLVLAIVATLLAILALSLRVTQAVPLIAPLVIACMTTWRGGGRQMGSPAVDAIAALSQSGAMLKDLTVFAVGFALARALADSGVFVAITHAIVSLPLAGCVPALLVVLTIVLGIFGVPAIVCAGLVAAASASLMPTALPVGQMILCAYAWAAASMLSVTSGTLTVVASSFAVALRPLVLGRNLLFLVSLGAVVAVVVTVIS